MVGKRDEDIPVVPEYLDVFADKFTGLSPKRTVKFSIDLIPSTISISKASYRMRLVELPEVKHQLKELEDQGFIKSNILS